VPFQYTRSQNRISKNQPFSIMNQFVLIFLFKTIFSTVFGALLQRNLRLDLNLESLRDCSVFFSSYQSELDILEAVLQGNVRYFVPLRLTELRQLKAINISSTLTLVIDSSRNYAGLNILRKASRQFYLHITDVTMANSYLNYYTKSKFDFKEGSSKQLVFVVSSTPVLAWYSAHSLCVGCVENSIKLNPNLSLEALFDKRRPNFGKQVAELNGLHADHISSWRTSERCRRLYPSTQKNLRKVGCLVEHMIAEIIARKLNFTIAYIPEERVRYETVGLTNYRRSVGKLYMDYYFWSTELTPMELLFSYDLIEPFFYCTPKNVYENFDARFWTTPFDSVTWGLGMILLGMSIFASQWTGYKYYSKLCSKNILRNWRKNKVLISFCCIAILCCYESIISSKLTARPPIVLLNTFLDLMINDYKILGYVGNADGTDKTELIALFKKYGILDRMNTSLAKNIPGSNSEAVHQFSQCNVTDHIGPGYSEAIEGSIKLKYPSIKCHRVKQDPIKTTTLYVFTGFIRKAAITTAQRLQESGNLVYLKNVDISSRLLQFRKYKTYLKTIVQEKMEDKLPVPFAMHDWKVASIIVLWLGLILLTLFLFVIEQSCVMFMIYLDIYISGSL